MRMKHGINSFKFLWHLKCREMALFTQILNPITGQNEWDARDDDYDYHQEVANAGFGDMLHDKERNSKYFQALRKTIALMHTNGREAHVLDIGTGTGILSMMAVKAGADSVTACEAFLPMANCAERIIKANAFSDKIKLIKKRSTDIKIGIDMQQKANLLVTELLDTELIGEGAIGIYNHAHDELLTDDVICIPAKATCYAQIVQSPLAAQFNSIKSIVNLDGELLLKSSKDVEKCPGEGTLHDVQLSQLPAMQFKKLSDVIEIFDFDFNRKLKRETKRTNNLQIKTICSGSTDLVFYWWSIQMDLENEIQLSCAPYWAHPDFKSLAEKCQSDIPLSNVIPWRYHWMQAIYFIPKPLHINSAGSEFILQCNHDEYSLWFDAFEVTKPSAKTTARHACSCSLHSTYGRSRIAQMNQSQSNKRYLQYLEDTITKESHVLSIGDGNLLGLATSKLGAATVICHEPHRCSRHFIDTMAKENSLENIQFIGKLDYLDDEDLRKISNIFAEPYFLTSILPWDNFYFGTLLQKIQPQLSDNVKISPHSARIYAIPVEFLDLHKIRTPIQNCEGFDLSLFDEMVKKSMAIAQSKVEAQPLWEYPGRALSLPQEILNVSFKEFSEDKKSNGNITIKHDGKCNGIALWVDWNIDGGNTLKSIVTTGPSQSVECGKFIEWDMFVRQGVHLFEESYQVINGKSTINWSIDFKPLNGEIKFNFNVLS